MHIFRKIAAGNKNVSSSNTCEILRCAAFDGPPSTDVLTSKRCTPGSSNDFTPKLKPTAHRSEAYQRKRSREIATIDPAVDCRGTALDAVRFERVTELTIPPATLLHRALNQGAGMQPPRFKCYGFFDTHAQRGQSQRSSDFVHRSVQCRRTGFTQENLLESILSHSRDPYLHSLSTYTETRNA